MAETNIEIAHFERAELADDVLRLRGTDPSGNPVSVTLGLPQYAALTMDVGYVINRSTGSSRLGTGPAPIDAIQATEVGHFVDALRNEPVLVFRHGQGRQSAFLVPLSKARRLAEALLAISEVAPPASPN